MSKELVFGAGAVILGGVLVFQNIFPYLSDRSYELTPEMYNLVGESRDDTKEYLALNEQATAYSFSVPSAGDAQGAAQHTGRVADAYSATLPVKARDGISVTDSATKISVTLAPEFYTTRGQKVEGDHIVYVNGRNKLVYTLKYNGLKEDIIVPEYRGDKMSFGFKLRLPAGVEARLDEAGNIGIYSADPTLFGNMSFGSDEDRKRVEKARENGEKTHLVMKVPYPIVKDAAGQTYSDKAAFELSEKKVIEAEAPTENLPPDAPRSSMRQNEYRLSLKARDLKDLPYPLSIDPAMVVTAAGDFNGLNKESGVEVDTTNNLIRRATLTGGQATVGTTTFGVIGQTRFCEATVAYNGYLYVSGGFDTGGNVSQNTSYYVPIGAGGNITTNFNVGPTLPNLIHCHQMVARSGFIYIFGGYRGSATGDVWRSKVRSDGSMSAWETLAGIGTGHYSGDAEIVGDYVYLVGGGSNAIRYAKFQADGSLSVWASTTAAYPGPGTITHGVQMASYNGVLYVSGGYNASGQGSFQNGIYYARPSSTGDVTAWITGPTMPQAKGGHVMEQWGGYLYVAAGCTGRGLLGDCDAETGAIFFVQINADGSLGTWRNNFASTAAVIWSDSTVHNGIWYRVGGCSSASINFGQCDAVGNQVMGMNYFTAKEAGEIYGAAWNGTNNLPGARAYFGTTVYNGYIYATGGYDSGYANATATVYYGSVASNGTVTWNTDVDSPLPNVRVGHVMAAHNGYMYLLGGRNYDGTTLYNTIHYAPINSDGSLGAWSSAGTNFTTARHLSQGMVYNGYIYVLGGCSVADCGVTPNSRLNDVQYAKLSSTGALENSGSCTPWCTAATGFTAARDAFAAHAYNGYIYVVGGADDGGTGFQNDTQFAALNSDGSLVSDNPGCVGTAAWCASTSFTTPRWGLASSIYNGYMYVAGGQHSGGQTNNVQYAKMNADGTIGTWTDTQVFTSARTAHGAAIVNGNIYIFGGDSGGAVQNGVQYQVIHNGGSGKPTSWSTATGTGATKRFSHATVAYNDYLYMSGGCGEFTVIVLPVCAQQGTGINQARTDILRASIGADGNLGNWSATTTAMPGGISYISHSMVAHDGYMYMAGGITIQNTNFAIQNTVFSVPIDPDGNITQAWTTLSSSPLSVTRAYMGSAVMNGRWYLASGCTNIDCTTGTNIVEMAGFQANGGLSVWSVTSGAQNLSVPVAGMGFAAYNGYLYAFGGCVIDGGSYCTDGANNTTHFTEITDSGGAITNGWSASTGGGGPIGGAGVYFAYNGYLYSIGGFDLSADIRQRTAMVPVLAGGGIGRWQIIGWDAGAKLGEDRVHASGAIYGGRMYVTGGQVASTTNVDSTNKTVHSATDYATIQSIPRIGSFSRRYDFGTGARPTQLITRGTKQAGSQFGLTYQSTNGASTTLDNTQTISDAGLGGDNLQSIALGSSRTLSRYFFVRYTIDDRYSAVFPDEDSESTVTDFDLYYIANPGKRLRGGRTFTEGADRGLDTRPE